MKIFLDDERDPDIVYENGDDWFVCRTIDEAQKWLEKPGFVTHVSVDGDMGKYTDSKGISRDIPGGVELVDWMRETGNWPSVSCLVHSQNPVKATQMRALIQQYFKPEDNIKE